MSIRTIIQESIARNPLGMKEALAEELRNRVALALEAKMKEDEHEDEDEDEDDEDEDEESEQIDEISVNKMLSYDKKAQAQRDRLNKKWDGGEASQKEKEKVIGREVGQDLAAKKIKSKTGKWPWELNTVDKIRYGITKEESE